jgi:cytochrome c oxidase subunit 3
MTAGSLAMPRRPVIERDRPPVIASTRIAMIALIMTELMLFAGFLGMYLVIRLAHEAWPPEGQPRLPLFVTALNTLVLFASVVPVTRALRATARGAGEYAARSLSLGLALGVVFLAVQGFEWSQLVHHGLTLASSQYGGASIC